ncbi:MAG: hypothetical protein Q7S20_11840 [Gemmatimonadaceae bacterium]|nr:hypothetical protein [Gemmatimonadaceae bacterium]
MAKAKGSAIIATMDFIRAEKGEDVLARVLEAIPSSDRRRILSCKPTEEVPLDLALMLWRSADEELRADEPDWVERAGGYAIEVPGVRMYSGILRKSSPREFLTQRVSLFRLYYHPGNMEVVEEEEEHAVLRLVGFDQADPLFCRRQTGGLRRVLTEAGGQEPLASHVRCVAEGDAFCEWELRWR